VRSGYPFTVQGVVVPSVFELFPNSRAYFEVQIRRNRHIARVKEPVDIASQQEAVLRLVLAPIAERTDVSCFKGRQCAFIRDRAPSPIDVGDEQAKLPLATPRANQLRLAIATGRSSLVDNFLTANAVRDGFPQPAAFGLFGVVSLERDDIRSPARWNGYLLAFREENGLQQNPATNREIASRI